MSRGCVHEGENVNTFGMHVRVDCLPILALYIEV